MALENDAFTQEVERRIAGKLGAAAGVAVASGPAIEPGSLQQAASVLSWFEPEALRPVGDDRLSIRPGERESLLAMCVPVRAGESERRWALPAERRIAGLRRLRESGLVAKALAANPRPAHDALQETIERALAGTLPPIEGLSLQELALIHTVVGWLGAAGFENLPDMGDVSARLDWLTLLEPFRHLAGAHFRGRAAELAQLRSYVGVLPPRSLRESAARTLTSVFSGPRREPLVIYGPGGVGKSTLVARFILEHAEAIEQERFPFAYLDLDRPEIIIDEPLTLLGETVRQLGVEYRHAAVICKRIRDGWLAKMSRIAQSGDDATETLQLIRSAAVKDFVSLLNGLEIGDRPLVVVIDTFEEAQYRGEFVVDSIIRTMNSVAELLPRLRVIIAGRAELHLAPAASLELKGFDEEAAIGYLASRGIGDEELARMLFKQVGGSPMTLKLAADLAEREGLDDGGLRIETRNVFFRRLGTDHVQRQLYTRVLGHIHNVKVRKLAHPGLVLRRVTPDLIRYVLAEPCGLEVASDAEALELFEDLKKEVSLVRMDPDGALRHRQDLRALMLDLLLQDQPEKSREIHRRAVDFYSRGRDSPPERAEEIYHRLWLQHDLGEVQARWRRDVARHLYGALHEFGGKEAAFLAARLGKDVEDAILQEARLEDWELLVARRAGGLLKEGRNIDALAAMDMRSERTPASPLVALQAAALEREGRSGPALAVFDRGIRSALEGRRRSQALRLAFLGAETALKLDDPAWSRTIGQYLEMLEKGRMGGVDRVESVAKRALLAVSAGGDPGELEGPLEDALANVREIILARRPNAAFLAAAVPGDAQALRLYRAFSSVGCPAVSDASLRSLAAHIATIDFMASQRAKAEPGVLARALRVPIKHSLTESWSEFLVSSPKALVGRTLAALLSKHSSHLDGAIFGRMGEMLLDGLGIRRQVQVPAGEIAWVEVVPSAGQLPERDRAFIVGALRAAFTSVDELRTFLGERLERSLDAINFETPGQTDPVVDLVGVADREGWLHLLLARAREARPNDAGLALAADRAGLSGLAGSAKVLEQVGRAVHSSGFVAAPSIWRERIGQIEAQVCRIEIDAQMRGTGFLIGVDMVLTADFVVGTFLSRSGGAARGLQFRFDYKADERGGTVTQGVVYRPARDWLVAHAPVAGTHGYALLRVSGAPGAQPIGSSRSEAGARLRRWIELRDRVEDPRPGDPLILFHYPYGQPLSLSTGTVAQWKQGAFRHDAQTAPGSSGAPCFGREFELVGLHSGADDAQGPARGFGVPITKVVEDLEAKSLQQLLSPRFT